MKLVWSRGASNQGGTGGWKQQKESGGGSLKRDAGVGDVWITKNMVNKQWGWTAGRGGGDLGIADQKKQGSIVTRAGKS